MLSFVHAPYLVNLGSPSADTLEKSVATVRHGLLRAHAIGAKGLVIHTGSAVTQHRDDALRQLHEHLLPLLEEIPEDGPDLLLEPMAGQGAMLCATVQDLEPYLAALDWHPKAGICLDTCHAFSAGHDLSTAEGVKETFDALHAIPRGGSSWSMPTTPRTCATPKGPAREHRRGSHRDAALRRHDAPPGGRGSVDLHRDAGRRGEAPRGHRTAEEAPRRLKRGSPAGWRAAARPPGVPPTGVEQRPSGRIRRPRPRHRLSVGCHRLTAR